MASKLTSNERDTILAQFQAVYEDETARGKVLDELWAKYKGSDKELDAHQYINSVSQLYHLCPKGTEIACVYLRSNETPNGNANRHWKVFVAMEHCGKPYVCQLTGYLLSIGIGKQSRNPNEQELVTNGYASDIAYWLASRLYGDTRGEDSIKYRTY